MSSKIKSIGSLKFFKNVRNQNILCVSDQNASRLGLLETWIISIWLYFFYRLPRPHWTFFQKGFIEIQKSSVCFYCWHLKNHWFGVSIFGHSKVVRQVNNNDHVDTRYNHHIRNAKEILPDTPLIAL